MGTKSLVTIGRQAFEVLTNFEKKNKEISEKFNIPETKMSNLREALIEAGWVEDGKITLAGKWFIKAIYQNPKISRRLK